MESLRSSASAGPLRFATPGSVPPTPRKSTRPRCPQCGTRRFRRDPSTSLVVCAQGHVLQGFRDEEAQDGDDWQVSTGKRAIKKIKRLKRSKASKAAKGVWHGYRSTFRVWQCFQLLLRWQIAALREEWPDLPDEIEPIARDIWAMYVSLRPELRPTPYEEVTAFAADLPPASSGGTRTPSRSQSRSRAPSRARSEASYAAAEASAARQRRSEESRRARRELRQRLREVGDDAPSSSEEDSEEEREARDASRGTGTASQWTDAETEEGWTTDAEPALAERGRRKRSWGGNRRRENGAMKERLPIMTTLAVLYLALITARVPVMMEDLRILVASHRVPYFNAIHILPHELVESISSHDTPRLEPSHLPSIQQLHERVALLARSLALDFGVCFPELNAAPVLWRCVESMLLPPTFYSAAKALASYIRLPMHAVPHEAVDAPWSAPAPEEREAAGEAATPKPKPAGTPYSLLSVNVRGKNSVPRCTALMAVVCVVVKMRYGCDGQERSEAAAAEPTASFVPPLDTWLAALEGTHAQFLTDPRSAYSVEADILDLDITQIDAFLDFAEENLVLSQQANAHAWRRREGIEDLLAFAPESAPAEEATDDPTTSPLFAIDEIRQRAIDALYKSSNASIPTRSSSSDHLAPGQNYLVTTGVALEEQPRQTQRLVEAAARIVGSTPVQLAETIGEVERLLIMMLKAESRSRNSKLRKEASQRIAAKRAAKAVPTVPEESEDTQAGPSSSRRRSTRSKQPTAGPSSASQPLVVSDDASDSDE